MIINAPLPVFMVLIQILQEGYDEMNCQNFVVYRVYLGALEEILMSLDL